MENVLQQDAGVEPAAASKAKTAKRRPWMGYIAIVPFFLVVILYELAPLAQLALDSVIGRDSEALGLENYIRVFTTPLYTQSIWNSVWISLLSAVVGIVVAFLAARFCSEAATILKASTFDYWFRIVIPNLMPSILGTLSVLFSNALAAYATAYALVMNNYALLALQITSRFRGDVQTDAATGGALAIVLIALMVICTLVNNYFTRRAAKGREIV